MEGQGLPCDNDNDKNVAPKRKLEQLMSNGVELGENGIRKNSKRK